jgi:glutaminase
MGESRSPNAGGRRRRVSPYLSRDIDNERDNFYIYAKSKKMAETDKSEPSGQVSTGQLPSPELVTALIAEAHNRFKANQEGKNSTAYPALERVPSDLFAVCVVGTNGTVYSVGDTEYEFTIMSVSKPFVFALICRELGVEEVRRRIGVNATGFAFNSLAGIERNQDGRTNPMVNSGAIAATSLAPGETLEAKWKFIHEGLSRFAGRRLELNEEVYLAASESNYRNRSIARLLQAYGRIYLDPDQTIDLYNRQCTLKVNAKDLAVMGATLANGGVNPITKERVVDVAECHGALAVMVTAGLYESSGDWLFETGLPGKSGISGGIVSVSPGKAGLGTFAPPLNSASHSVKGQLVAGFLSQELGMNLLVSQPEIQ